MTHKTATRGHQGVRPGHALAQMRGGILEAQVAMDIELEFLRMEMDKIVDIKMLELRFGVLHTTEREVMLTAEYCLTIDRVDVAIAVLTGWARNPYRKAGA